MKEILDFLRRLRQHNNREWFNAHKEEYTRLRKDFELYINQIIALLSEKDEELRGLEAKECMFRIYRSYSLGVAYKPCVVRGRNHFGNVRVGASAGSDTDRFLAGIHVGYEHNYVLHSGWVLYWQVKSDMMIKGRDFFRTGVALGFKIPVK